VVLFPSSRVTAIKLRFFPFDNKNIYLMTDCLEWLNLNGRDAERWNDIKIKNSDIFHQLLLAMLVV
jgi:hypothetical protein